MNFDTPPPKKDKDKAGFDATSRRRFLIGTAALALVGVGLKEYQDAQEEKEEKLTDIERDQETFDREYSPRFADEMMGYKEFYGELKFDEVLFVDDFGKPIGDPVKIVDFGGTSPGERDEHGIIKGKLSQEWLDAVRQDVCQKHGIVYSAEKDLPRQMQLLFVAREMKGALADEGIEADTYLGVAKAMGDKGVVGVPETSRLEYIKTEGMKTSKRIPPGAYNEILFVLPGLAAQESKYANDAVSSTGAKGIMQFMPDTWKEVGEGNILNFTDQVAAVGKLMDRKYQYLLTHKKDNVSQELRTIQEQFFGGDAKQFEHYFLAPILINSYNSGEGRLAKCIKLFVETYPTRESWVKQFGAYADGVGYDLYLSMTKLCSEVVGRDKDGDEIRRIRGYGRDSSQYVVRAYTLAELLKEKE
jgi:hypothetical protein